MKKLKIFLITASLIMPAVSSAKTLKDIFSKPLIIGASVSNDFRAKSPGKTLALRYTDDKNITTIARNGSSSVKVMPLVSADDVKKSSIIIAFDLFFWDSTLKSADESLKQLKRLTELATKHKIPLIIGEIPAIMPPYQPQRTEINKQIATLCSENKNCYRFDLDNLLRKLMMDGHIQSEGKLYTAEELLPDGLHISPVASEILANEMLRVIPI